MSQLEQITEDLKAGKYSKEEALELIVTCVGVLEWNIVVTDNEDPEADVTGLVIGTSEYIDEIFNEGEQSEEEAEFEELD
jgi:hypothetical protein